MTPPPGLPRDPRLDDLFIRYWDGALSDVEFLELEQRLAASPADRDWFRFLTQQAVTVAELTAVARAGSLVSGEWSEPSPPPASPHSPPTTHHSPKWTRRRVLGYAGAGLAAGVGVAAVGLRFIPSGPPPVRLTSSRGGVSVMTGDGWPVAPGAPVPPGATVSTTGLNSSAVLAYPDGTALSLAGDSTLTVTDDGRRLLLQKGNLTADVPPQPGGGFAPVLATALITLTDLGGSVTTLGHADRSTEVGVRKGLVTVDAPSGERLAVVRAGELLTVKAGGAHRKQPLPATPDTFAWDLNRPLPDGWHVGRRDLTAEGPVVRPEFWFDPYHQSVMSQIRSDQQWSRGFFRLFPDSVVRVRYRVERAGPSQICFCVRTAEPSSSETGMLECNDAFTEARPGQWQWREVRAGDMLDNIHTPRFGPPWVGFLVIVNTYEADLGLRIAEFRVSRPGGAGAVY